MGVDIVRRDAWGAARFIEKDAIPLPYPVEVVLATYTGTAPCHDLDHCKLLLRDLQRKHKEELGEFDINWNFMISSDGTIFEGRGWYCNAAKSPRHLALQFRSLDVAYIGRTKEDVTPRMIFAMEALIRHAVQEDMIPGYFEYLEDKECPWPKLF